jgi:bifunctional non-homologous end joining protein LigD
MWAPRANLEYDSRRRCCLERQTSRLLLRGYYKGDQLIFADKVGTGFDLATGHELATRLRKIDRKGPPFASVPRQCLRGARWVEPRLVVEVTFSTWTSDHVLWHPSLEGIREDTAARDVKLERPARPRRSANSGP